MLLIVFIISLYLNYRLGSENFSGGYSTGEQVGFVILSVFGFIFLLILIPNVLR
jgi:hypothetical protein